MGTVGGIRNRAALVSEGRQSGCTGAWLLTPNKEFCFRLTVLHWNGRATGQRNTEKGATLLAVSPPCGPSRRLGGLVRMKINYQFFTYNFGLFNRRAHSANHKARTRGRPPTGGNFLTSVQGDHHVGVLLRGRMHAV